MPEHYDDSIFGYTQQGVPNPNVPHVHPYPTRYHGPNYTVPGVSKLPYMQRPYAKPPFMGTGQSGLGDMFPSMTSARALDAALGALAGYVFAPTKDQAVMHGVAGAAIVYFTGAIGLIGMLGYEGYLMQKKTGLRSDITEPRRA